MFTILKLVTIALVALAISGTSPVGAFAFVILCLAVTMLGRLAAFAARPFLFGLFAAWGVKESGLLRPRTRSRHDRQQFPWEERGDDLPPEL
jgi:uncharacterized membrane protein YcjF (UPF0283 family)